MARAQRPRDIFDLALVQYPVFERGILIRAPSDADAGGRTSMWMPDGGILRRAISGRNSGNNT